MRRPLALLRPIVVLALLCAFALAASACSSGSGDETSRPSPAPQVPLTGTNWVLTDRSDLGVDLGDVAVTATFGATSVSGNSGCNTYRASVSRDGQKLEVGNDIAVTQVACPPPQNTIENKYLAALARVRLFSITGTTLALQNVQGDTMLVYRASGPADVVGDWTVASYYSGTAIQSVATGTTMTATFTKDTVSGNAGCNSYNGSVTLTRTTIAVGPLASTLKLCDEPIATQEQQYLAALALATTYEVSGNAMTLFRDGGTIAATYERR